MLLEKSDGLLFLMPVYNPEMVTKQHPYECAKLRDFVQRHIEQKNISHSQQARSRMEGATPSGAPAKGKAEGEDESSRQKSKSHRRLHTLDSKRLL